MKKGLPLDISRCSNDECVRRHYCKRWKCIPPNVILTYSKFDSKDCKYFIDGGNICPKCGFVGTDEEPVYTESELMYENEIDDPQYGGALIWVEILHCPNCDG